ncbi:phosphoribosyltransferase [Rhabdobacter roseus]|uniref:Putative phosphoribosyltransferase n=1 Tax=Rhabdobacter roseus TaxID=1655419 RepID=A0A840TLL6_9BACT|nr:phosphoribosyltransferase family protein [Rhabdobacter roseus]MBB5282452.1 putative phosphoribosyltransferase [Rhabdobacter roseus]
MKDQSKEIVFRNRREAGQELGRFLAPKYQSTHPLVLGVPRGGAEVAYYVARRLGADFALIVAKKLPFPGHEEYGFGAVAEEGVVYVSERGQKTLDAPVIRRIIQEQTDEVARRVQQYRQGSPLPRMKDRTVLLVDDGIATGATLVPLVELCQQKEAAKVVVAAPVSGTTYDRGLQKADALEVLVQPRPFFSVGQAYEDFGEFTDEQLAALMRQAESEAP